MMSARAANVAFVLTAIAVAAVCTGAAAAKECPEPMVLGSAQDVALDSAVTRVRLPLAKGALPSKVELVLRDIRFETHPGTQLHVHLERRGDGDPVERARVGTLSFYLPTPAGGGTTSRTFDVSEELHRLAAAAPGLEAVEVVFEATSGLGGRAAGAAFDPEARLTIGEVALREKGE